MRALLAIALLSAGVSADGLVLSRAVMEVEVPEQRAILAFDGERERLVIETTAVGEGEEFAWIVPLPAEPRITAVGRGAFETLTMHLHPLLHDTGGGLALALAIATLIFAGLWWIFERGARLLWVIPILVCGGLAALSTIVLFAPKGAFESSAALATSGQGVVGSYAVETITSGGAEATLAWLTKEGFRLAPEAREVVAKLAAEGWVFATGKLRPPGEGGRRFQPHPLCFDFPTQEAIYPMRLTATTGKPLRLELFVLGAMRAEVTGLRVEACASVEKSAPDGKPRFAFSLPFAEDGIPLAQFDLARIGHGVSVITRLSGDVGGTGGADLRPRWVEFEYHRRQVHSGRAAWGSAADAGMGALLLVLVAAHLVHQRGRARVKWRLALAAGVLVAIVARTRCDVVEESRILERDLDSHPRSLIVDASLDPARFERLVAKGRNYFTGEALREEASPGNFMRGERDSQGKLEYIVYDARGAAWSSKDWGH